MSERLAAGAFRGGAASAATTPLHSLPAVCSPLPARRHCLNRPCRCTTCTAGCTACRERNDGLYRVITYLVAKMVEELGIALFNSIIFGGWMGGWWSVVL